MDHESLTSMTSGEGFDSSVVRVADIERSSHEEEDESSLTSVTEYESHGCVLALYSPEHDKDSEEGAVPSVVGVVDDLDSPTSITLE